MTQLLVSVRSADEAIAALEGGAGVIDVKEPLGGSLGMADTSVIRAVADAVAGRRPVSAALGELLDSEKLPRNEGARLPTLRYLKIGLSGCGERDLGEIQGRIQRLARDVAPEATTVRWVAVAYADWQRANAPRPERVADIALSNNSFWGALLIDTWKKDGKALLDWLPIDAVERLCRRLHASDVPVALAGSLDPRAIRQLLPLEPDLIAVRGAACVGRDRNARVDRALVRQLVTLLNDAVPQRLLPMP